MARGSTSRSQAAKKGSASRRDAEESTNNRRGSSNRQEMSGKRGVNASSGSQKRTSLGSKSANSR